MVCMFQGSLGGEAMDLRVPRLRAGVLPSAILVCLMLFLPAAASAVIIPLSATIDCAQANAGAGTCGAGGSGTGSATITLDTVSNLLSWNIQWSGLSAPITVAHFHGPALPSQNAGVQVNFGSISGLVSPSIGSTTISALQESDLLNDLWYINIHSTSFTGGEIRGQVTVIPEPATLMLVAVGLAVVGAARRRDR
jgi:hypothetical protein